MTKKDVDNDYEILQYKMLSQRSGLYRAKVMIGKAGVDMCLNRLI